MLSTRPCSRAPTASTGHPWPQSDSPQAHVVYDASDPEHPYKAAILDKGFAVSADGLSWQALDVPAIQSFDEGNFSLCPDSHLFIHTVKRTGPHGSSVAFATSTDFARWEDYGVVFHADDYDQDLGRQTIAVRLADSHLKQSEDDTPEHYSVQIYNMGVSRYEGLYIGLPSMYHHTGKVLPEWPDFAQLRLAPSIRECVDKHGDYTDFYNIQIACSRALKAWTRIANRETLYRNLDPTCRRLRPTDPYRSLRRDYPRRRTVALLQWNKTIRIYKIRLRKGLR